jgi:N-acetylglucosaminylphosphatidylinositol deacetylase
MLRLRPTASRLITRLGLSRRPARWVLRIGVILLVLPLFLQWLVAYVVGSDARLLPAELQNAKNLLIVTAHPDDECLFFAPSILGVLDRNHEVRGSLLVMSTGEDMSEVDIGDIKKASC